MPIDLEIVTPTRLAFRAAVDSFTGPGAIGEFGVLPGHRPLLASLRAGVVRCIQGGKARKLAIGPGFAEVERDRVIVLTDAVVDPERIETSEERDEALRTARSERDAADARMKAWRGPITAGEFEEARLAYEWASARIDALTD